RGFFVVGETLNSVLGSTSSPTGNENCFDKVFAGAHTALAMTRTTHRSGHLVGLKAQPAIYACIPAGNMSTRFSRPELTGTKWEDTGG
ncbi:MAG TPA: hypothetical protein DCE18_13345, partial [Syntrophobacteraceae bacterium]|nr:hypothetical protein [Syntrophobacteraceae bacterium]